jgi:putative hemolysin
LFAKNLTEDSFHLKDFVRKPLYVHENTPVYKVMEQFKRHKLHNAMIIDEYGDVQGMIAMDDVVDALIGDATEYNQEEYSILKRDENSWLADGQYPYFEFLHYFNISAKEEEGNYNTLAGFILHHLQHIPKPGEKVKWNIFEFEIIDMDERRIDKILITKKHRENQPSLEVE